jgi:hypothetical protein
MILHQEVQKKAQAELDNLLQGRLPEHSDIADPDQVPYLTAILYELHR